MKKIACLFLLPLLPWGCTTDFKLNADYKEIMVIWGLLSQNDTTHYIRIQRAYLNENTSALVVAQNPDSIYYPDILNAVVSQEGTSNSWTLERVDGDTLPEPIQKELGIFASSPNILYRFTAILSESASYRINVENTVSGLTATAVTPLVRDFHVTRPVTGISANFIGSSDYRVLWDATSSAPLHDLHIRMHYRIANDFPPYTSVKDTFVDIVIFKTKTFTAGNSEYDISKEVFYNSVQAKLDPVPGFIRIVDSLDFTFYVGSKELANYVNFNQAQTGLTANQISTQYTNVEGGLGLFASRYKKVIEDIPLTPGSTDTLACGQVTDELNFAPSSGNPNWPFCD